MDAFLTIYRKDYIWPYVKTFGVSKGPTPSRPQQDIYGPPPPKQPCVCPGDMKMPEAARVLVGAPNPATSDWSRAGPMGPLLDPKLYPASVSAPPENESSRFDQPNAFMKKLQEKYPYLYNALQDAPPADLMQKVDFDRLRTTYQVDYCRDGVSTDAYDRLLEASGMGPDSTCPPRKPLPGEPCRPNQRAIAFRPPSIGKCGKKESKCDGPPSSDTKLSTEYRDYINKLGGQIIKQKLHWSNRNAGN